MAITFLDDTDKLSLQSGINHNAAAIATERARVNELVAMRGYDGSIEWSIDNWQEHGYILRVVTNGFTALVEFTHRITQWSTSYKRSIQLPEYLQPLGYNEIFNNGKLLFYVEKTDDGAQLVIENVSGAIVEYPHSPIACDYPLARPSVNEVSDIRIGYDGTTYENAGEAVRSQFKAVHDSLRNEEKAVIDKLAPAFEASGPVAVCEPVEGYPLEVVSTINEKEDGTEWERITLTQCGKNLFSGGREITFTQAKTITLEKPIPAGTYFISVGSYTGSGENCPAVVWQYADNTDAISLSMRYHPNGRTVTFTQPVTRVVLYSNGYSASSSKDVSCTLYDVQIEPGNVRTAYEEYKGYTELTADFANLDEAHVLFGSYNWQTGVLDTGDDGHYQHDPETNTFTLIENISTHVPPTVRNIPAMAGTNAFYSDCGDTTVSGKADPVAIIEKQEARLAALEAAIVNNT